MPNQKRWRLKRDLDQATNNISIAGEYLVRVGSEFKGIHDEYYLQLQRIFVVTEGIKGVIQSIKDSI